MALMAECRRISCCVTQARESVKRPSRHSVISKFRRLVEAVSIVQKRRVSLPPFVFADWLLTTRICHEKP